MKIAVLGTKSGPSYAVCNYLNARFPGCAFVFEGSEPRRAFLMRRVRKLGFLRVAGQVVFQSAAVPLLKLASRTRLGQIFKEFELSTQAIAGHEISSVNTTEAIDLMRRLQPAVIVLAGTRIIGREFIEHVGCPIVNIHAGITPQYRGVHGGYWALVEQRPELCGVTVHQVDAGIDTGGVLKQALIQPASNDNFATYPWIQLGVGLRLLSEVLPEFIAGGPRCPLPSTGESRLRTHPTIYEYLRYRVLRGVK